MPGRRAGSPIAVYVQVQCREPKTGQEKVQFYCKDDWLWPIVIIYLWYAYTVEWGEFFLWEFKQGHTVYVAASFREENMIFQFLFLSYFTHKVLCAITLKFLGSKIHRKAPFNKQMFLNFANHCCFHSKNGCKNYCKHFVANKILKIPYPLKFSQMNNRSNFLHEKM